MRTKLINSWFKCIFDKRRHNGAFLFVHAYSQLQNPKKNAASTVVSSQMKNQAAQSQINAVNSTSPISGGNKETARRLTEDEVLRRLFSPASNLPEGRKGPAIVLTAPGTERSVTHSQIENLISYALDQLKKHGVKEGDKVVFYCPNSPELSSTILACWGLNAMVTLVDYRAKREDVLEISKKLGAKVLITSKKMYSDYAKNTKFFTEDGLDVLDVAAFNDFKDTAKKSQINLQTLKLDGPAFTILTSGTTGTPKTSVHTLRSLVLNIIDLAEAADLQPEMTALTPLPISHIFGLSVFLVTQVL